MSAHKLLHPAQVRPARTYSIFLQEQHRDEDIERCMAHFDTLGLSLKDRVGLADMFRSIITMPVERCYQYAN